MLCTQLIENLCLTAAALSCVTVQVVIFNDVALRDCQNCRIGKPNRDAQDRLHWMERQDLSCTYLAHHELESVCISIIVIAVQVVGPSVRAFGMCVDANALLCASP